jgi:putative sterol carrier protein
MVSTSEATKLEMSLQAFSGRFNSNERVRKLIKGWNRSVMLEATDTGSHFSLIISDLALTEVKKGLIQGDPPIHLQAEEDVLRRVFTGEYNPAAALMDGALAVFSDERDKVKLEAIAMVVWGVAKR